MIKTPSRHGITNRRNSEHAIFPKVTFGVSYLRNGFTLGFTLESKSIAITLLYSRIIDIIDLINNSYQCVINMCKKRNNY